MAENRMLTYGEYYQMRGGEFQLGDRVAVRVVAVVGYDEDWAAYAGLSEWSDYRIANTGDKISYEAARGLFPTLDAMFTWRG